MYLVVLVKEGVEVQRDEYQRNIVGLNVYLMEYSWDSCLKGSAGSLFGSLKCIAHYSSQQVIRLRELLPLPLLTIFLSISHRISKQILAS